MTKVAILQSNYIPWKGYFDIIRQVDLFIFYDDLQYTSRDWRNRNKIVTRQGTKWLTIPCGTSRNRLINEVRVDNTSWQQKHFQLLETNYKKAPFWAQYEYLLSEWYLQTKWKFLSELNQHIIRQISKDLLGCNTEFANSVSYSLTQSKESRILELLQKVGATSYLSGPAARAYLTNESFERHNIELHYISYDSYPAYPQQFGACEHAVTILDLLLNTGPEATNYMLPLD